MKNLPLFSILLFSLVSHAAISIDTVVVGDAGNAVNSGSLGSSMGNVAYEYRIGRTEVTNAQYAAFLNAVAKTDTHGLYNSDMTGYPALGGITRSGSSGSYAYTATGMTTLPVHSVSFWDAARFTNWLTNGQPTGAQGTGTTETGVYTLGGVTSPVAAAMNRDVTAWTNGGVAIASRDEWHKAAYYQPTASGGDADNYWLYANGANTPPTASAPNTSNNSANYNNTWPYFTELGAIATSAEAGSYPNTSSYYGTLDQNGNLKEWTDDYTDTFFNDSAFALGGAFNTTSSELQASGYAFVSATLENTATGFRVSSLNPIVIPEPASLLLMTGAMSLLGFTCLRIRRSAR